MVVSKGILGGNRNTKKFSRSLSRSLVQRSVGHCLYLDWTFSRCFDRTGKTELIFRDYYFSGVPLMHTLGGGREYLEPWVCEYHPPGVPSREEGGK